MGATRTWPAAAALVLVGTLAGAGCGEKIAIPEPEGEVGIKKYVANRDLELEDPRQLVVAQGGLFVVAGTGLVKYDLEFGSSTQGPPQLGSDLRALCAEQTGKWIFVWDQASRIVSWVTRDSLVVGGSLGLDSVQRVEAMAASPVGVEALPGALTFLYLSDPGAGVIWRYAFDEFGGLSPYGLLARSNGNSVRDVRVPAGIARDGEGFLFVCDRDTSRNWVIRFDPTPDEEDEDRRGRATLLPEIVPCQPVPAAEDYVIGDAPACGETDWRGGVSDADGEFNAPRAVAQDGLGRVFVADAGNDRVQIFAPQGVYDFQFGDAVMTPGPLAIAVVDVRTGTDAEDFMFGARLFLVLPDANIVRSFYSSEYDEWVNRRPRPPE